LATRWLLVLIAIFTTACTAQSPVAAAHVEATSTPTISIAKLLETATPIAIETPVNPGSGSALISPVRVAIEETHGIVRVDLRDLNGILLARQLAPTGASEIWLPFYVDGRTAALLVTSIEDEYGRLMSVSSFEVELLAEGENQIEPEDSQPAIEFSAPQNGMRLESASVRIYAFVDSEDGRAFNIRFITREGRVVANRDAYSEDGIVQAEVTANFEEPTFVRVVISRSIGGAIIQLNSVEVELVP
jgi:hypothetical protein